MRPTQLTDDEVITRVTESLASCNPPIDFGSIESGDFEDGRRILALINFLKQGNGTLGEAMRRNPDQVFNLVSSALEGIQGRSSLPPLTPQDITGRDKSKMIQLFRWILMVCPGKPEESSNPLESVHQT
jgi:hypothetical protein